jgi:hypothetical protein
MKAVVTQADIGTPVITQPAFEHVSTARGPLPNPVALEKVSRLCRDYAELREGQPFAIIVCEKRRVGEPSRDSLILAVKPSWSYAAGASMIADGEIILPSKEYARYHRGAIHLEDGSVTVAPHAIDATVFVAFGQANIGRMLFGSESIEMIMAGPQATLAAKLLRLADRIRFSFTVDPFTGLMLSIGKEIGERIRILKAAIVLNAGDFVRTDGAKLMMRELRRYGFSRDDVAKLILVAMAKEADRTVRSFMDKLFAPPV